MHSNTQTRTQRERVRAPREQTTSKPLCPLHWVCETRSPDPPHCLLWDGRQTPQKTWPRKKKKAIVVGGSKPSCREVIQFSLAATEGKKEEEEIKEKKEKEESCGGGNEGWEGWWAPEVTRLRLHGLHKGVRPRGFVDLAATGLSSPGHWRRDERLRKSRIQPCTSTARVCVCVWVKEREAAFHYSQGNKFEILPKCNCNLQVFPLNGLNC